MKKIISLSLVLALFLTVFTACSNADPNVKQTTESQSDEYEVDTEENTSAVSSANNDDNVVDSEYFANRSYELCFLLAVNSFNKPDDISVNALVQFAFCRIYYDNLTDMPRSGVKTREATVKQIQAQIQKDFGSVSVDVTKSDLYNRDKKKFEMWEPLYGSDIYFNTKSEKVSNSEYNVTSTFYNDEAKTEIKGTTVMTVGIAKDGKQYIKKLSSK